MEFVRRVVLISGQELAPKFAVTIQVMKHIDNKVGVVDSENGVSFQPLGLVHLLYRQDMYDKKTDEDQKTPDPLIHLHAPRELTL